MTPGNLAASVRARLLNSARDSKQDFNLVLLRYVLERLLYRLSISQHSDQFLLKGALLFDLWFDLPHRPTRDVDLLGICSTELPDIEEIFRSICRVEVPDGVEFSPETVKATEIRKEANYAGVRVRLLAVLDRAHCQVQVDIGFGDVVTPGAELAEYPALLAGFATPKLRVYPRYSVVAEKLEAISSLGVTNSRMKDYFDLWILALHADFDGDTLRQAIRATFDRRRTELAAELPLGLTDVFAQDIHKQAQWQAFLGKNRLEASDLRAVVTSLGSFLAPVMGAAHAHQPFLARWKGGGPWTAAAAP